MTYKEIGTRIRKQRWKDTAFNIWPERRLLMRQASRHAK